jgi:hypothetical protein
MIEFKCPNCSFSFTEADKIWDKAVKNAQCPKCKTSNAELDFGSEFQIHTNTHPLEKTKLSKETFYPRLIISIICWATSFIAIIFSGDIVGGITKKAFILNQYKYLFWAFIFFYPWIALLVMNVGWIKNNRVNLFWPYSGTLVAIYAVVISWGFALLYAPLGIILAVWLVIYHLHLGSWDNE